MDAPVGRVVGHRWVVGIAGLLAVGAVGIGGDARADVSTIVPSVVVPLEPARVLDTRHGIGVSAGALGPGQTVVLQVTGAGGVPSGATGILLNLAVTGATGAGYVSAYPAGEPRPETSVINYTGGEDVANMVTAVLNDAGALELFNAQATTHLIADVAGYLMPGAGAVGPVGPRGPPGPAGPGVTFLDIDVATGPISVVAELGEVEIRAACSAIAQLQFAAPVLGNPSNDLLVGGISGEANDPLSTVDDVVRVADTSGALTYNFSDETAVHFSGLVEHAVVGEAFQVELHMSQGSPCRLWGTTLALE